MRKSNITIMETEIKNLKTDNQKKDQQIVSLKEKIQEQNQEV